MRPLAPVFLTAPCFMAEFKSVGLMMKKVTVNQCPADQLTIQHLDQLTSQNIPDAAVQSTAIIHMTMFTKVT